MTGENGSPETPDWHPEPRLCELTLAEANTRRWAETLARIADPENIIRGTE